MIVRSLRAIVGSDLVMSSEKKRVPALKPATLIAWLRMGGTVATWEKYMNGEKVDWFSMPPQTKSDWIGVRTRRRWNERSRR